MVFGAAIAVRSGGGIVPLRGGRGELIHCIGASQWDGKKRCGDQAYGPRFHTYPLLEIPFLNASMVYRLIPLIPLDGSCVGIPRLDALANILARTKKICTLLSSIKEGRKSRRPIHRRCDKSRRFRGIRAGGVICRYFLRDKNRPNMPKRVLFFVSSVFSFLK